MLENKEGIARDKIEKQTPFLIVYINNTFSGMLAYVNIIIICSNT